MVNTVGDYNHNKKDRMSWYIEINGKRFLLGDIVVGYQEKEPYAPIIHVVVYVANDFNRSGLFPISAKTMRGLIGKIKRHEYKLVKPGH